MPALFPRIVNDLQSLRFELEAEADIRLQDVMTTKLDVIFPKARPEMPILCAALKGIVAR